MEPTQPPQQPSAPAPAVGPEQHTIQPSAPMSSSSMKKIKSGRGKKMLTILLLLMLIAGVGGLGYLYMTAKSDLDTAKTSIDSKDKEIAKLNTQLESSNPEDAFIAEYNDADLSNSLCSGEPLGMFDIHINEKYAVFRYLCANVDYKVPIRIAAFQKMSDGTYEFTYGASTLNPNGMPDYLYDSEPDFFGGAYGAKKY